MLAIEGNVEKAKEALAGLKRDFGDRHEVMGIEGWLALSTGDYATAADRFQAVAKRNQDTALTAMWTRALWAHEKYQEAIEIMQRWLEGQPRDPL